MNGYYHEAFWVVIGTAAPVIGLALTVLFVELVRNSIVAELVQHRFVGVIALLGFLISVVDFVAMIWLLNSSITSLASSVDAYPLETAEFVVLTGLFGVIGVSAILGILVLLQKVLSGRSPGEDGQE